MSEASEALREALTEAGTLEVLLASPELLERALEALDAYGAEVRARADGGEPLGARRRAREGLQGGPQVRQFLDSQPNGGTQGPRSPTGRYGPREHREGGAPMVSKDRIVEASRRIGEGRGAVFRVRGTFPWALYPDKGGWHLETIGFVAWFPRLGVWFSTSGEGEPSIQVAFYRDDGAKVAHMAWLSSDLTAIDDLEPGPDGAYVEPDGMEAIA